MYSAKEAVRIRKKRVMQRRSLRQIKELLDLPTYHGWPPIRSAEVY